MPVIDEAQLARIEATHRGFLYQHLVTVLCVLRPAPGQTTVLVESDEDVELKGTASHLYLQVKNLSDTIAPSDIASALTRFAAIRALHKSGQRSETPTFAIVSSSEPGPKLTKQLAEPSWPADVKLWTPSRPASAPEMAVPADIVGAFNACVAAAETVNLSRLLPATLVWKLAAVVQGLATGAFGVDHEIPMDAVPDLCEQIQREADYLPPPPEPYHPQTNEPAFQNDHRVRLIVGVSGSGKTAWASEGASHATSRVVYAKATESGRESFAIWIASHIATHALASNRRAVADAFRPGALGEESLRLVDQAARAAGADLTVVVDDAHRVDATEMLHATRSAVGTKWILLSHPTEASRELAAFLGIQPEVLGGWSPDTIALLCEAAGVAATPTATAGLAVLTLGAPLLTTNAIGLAARNHGGDLASLVAHLEAGTHLETTAVEHVLRRDVVSSLSEAARGALGLLGIPRASLPLETIYHLCVGALQISTEQVAAAVRELVEWGVLQPQDSGWLAVHDAFRSAATRERRVLGDDQRRRMAVTLRACMEALLQEERARLDNVVDYLRVLIELGDVSTVAEVATGLEEWWREHGLRDTVFRVLEVALTTPHANAQDRFLVADCLAFLALESRDGMGAARWIDEQKRIAAGFAVPTAETEARIVIKELLLANLHGDYARAKTIVVDALRWLDPDGRGTRVVHYTLALASVAARDFGPAETSLRSQIDGYLGDLGLSRGTIFGANPDEIEAMLPEDGDHSADLRHLADCFFLLARVLEGLNRPNCLDYIWAMKFYDLANSPASAIKAGIEVVDGFLRMNDAPQALRILEGSLLPLIRRRGLVGHSLDVRSLYAVALACDGRTEQADAELSKLQPYLRNLSVKDEKVIGMRRRIIEDARGFFLSTKSHRPNS